jgi:hypothetical protein
MNDELRAIGGEILSVGGTATKYNFAHRRHVQI